MKIKMQRRVSLTPRDIHLLNELYENVVLSFSQVCRKAFPGRAKPTVVNRLGRLEGMGVIERWRIPVLNVKTPGPGIFVVYQITKKGVNVLKGEYLSLELRDKPVRLHGYSIYHDLLLVDAMDALKARFPGAKVIHGRLAEYVADGDKVVEPDAVMEMPGSHERWAVELELTAKSERRYREIVLRYRLSRAFDRVLYVVGHSEIVPKLTRVLDKQPGELSATLPTEKFLAIGLTALLPIEKSANNQEKMTINNNEKETISHE